MKKRLIQSLAFLLTSSTFTFADIISVSETNLGGDNPATTGNNAFGEDVQNFSDRTHQHNGVAFDGVTQLLSTTGTTIVPLPAYLLGGDIVRFANNARDNVGYSATVTVDAPSNFFLLLDNRLNGPAGDQSSGQFSDPTLGGSLQWVINDGWTRVNTGISPTGQPDYTGVDESFGGQGVGPGLSIDQFYSVYQSSAPSTSITLQNQAISGNMYSLVAMEAIPEPGTISLFAFGLVGLYLAGRRFRHA